MGKFVAGFIASTVIALVFGFMFAIGESNFINAVCKAGETPHEIYIEDDKDRALVCTYLNREAGLDQWNKGP